MRYVWRPPNRQVDRRPGLYRARDREAALRAEAGLTPRRFPPIHSQDDPSEAALLTGLRNSTSTFF